MKVFLLVMMFILTSSTLQADYILKYKMDTETQTYMYHSDTQSKLVSGSGDERSEIYKVGKKIYIVSYEDGEKNIVDMDEMKKMSQAFGGMDSSAYTQKNEPLKYTIKKTGKKVKVGGIKGEIWIVSGEDNGEKFKEEVVVTNDKRVVKTIHAMFKALSAMSTEEIEDNLLEIQKGYVAIKADGMALESFSEKKVSSAVYQLPKDAKQQKMPDFSQISGKSGKSKSMDGCYETVCCGQTSGKSTVLAPALKSSFNGYKLVGSSVCDFMGLGSLMNIKSVEGALYKRGNDNIQLTLSLDDSEGGILRSTKKNLQSGHPVGMVEDIKNYKESKQNGVKVISGILMPMNQETVEYLINSKTTLSITRIRKTNKEPSLTKVVSSGGVNLNKLQASVASQQTSSSKKPMKQEDVDVDKAVDMLKSFF
jgi:hypothetical protein